jgi:hypothetical protein
MSGGNRSTPDQQTATAAGVSNAVGFGSETGSTAHSEGGSVARLGVDVKAAVKTPQCMLDALADAETLRLSTSALGDAGCYGEIAVEHLRHLGVYPFSSCANSAIGYARLAAAAAFLAVPDLRYPDLTPFQQGVADFYDDRTRIEKGD